MKLVNAQQMRAFDSHAINALGLSSKLLMESAGRSLVEALWEQYPDSFAEKIYILCASGNNSSDGYVVARVLMQRGCTVEVVSTKSISDLKSECLENAKQYLSLGGRLSEFSDSTQFSDAGLIIDALVGTGLKESLRGSALSLVELANQFNNAKRISIDLPSGQSSDERPISGVFFDAETVFALQLPKWGNLREQGVGSLRVLDIGIPTDIDEVEEVRARVITDKYLSNLDDWKRYGSKRDHKGTRGHVLVLAGESGKYGAAKLAGNAALKCGAGLVTLCLPEAAHESLSPHLVELMSVSRESDIGQHFERCSSLVIGPGLGQKTDSISAVQSYLERSGELSVPTVIDADALNILSNNRDLLSLVHENCVLTPHPGEMARLLSITTEQVQADRVSAVTELSNMCSCFVLLKGANTLLAGPSSDDSSDLWCNPVSTSALATAGSGDVLSGVLGALLARGCSSSFAALSSVYAHSMAGVLLESRQGGALGSLASDISEVTPLVLNAMQSVYADCAESSGRKSGRFTLLPSTASRVYALARSNFYGF